MVLEDVLEMDDLGGLGADGEQSDLVQHLRGAVHTASNPRHRHFLNTQGRQQRRDIGSVKNIMTMIRYEDEMRL